MKIVKIAACAVVCLICCELGIAQNIGNPLADFRVGIHSGSWTLKREQLLEAESQDPYRSCPDPYCARCAKHLADYGHEYQYLGGPSQRQLWYWGTCGNVAIVTQRGYDQRGLPYSLRGRPASAIISWEYLQTLNHAIMEQVNARNAVAIEEAARDRIVLLTQLLADATEQLRLTEEAWKQIEPQGDSCPKVSPQVVKSKTVGHCCTKTYKQFCVDMRAGRYEVASQGMCVYCLAQARYQFDLEYVASVETELALAWQYLMQANVEATEAVRIALLSKDDADKATRFKRIQYKPPKYREVLAAMGGTSEPPLENGKESKEKTP
jgi:hypothetical protein